MYTSDCVNWNQEMEDWIDKLHITVGNQMRKTCTIQDIYMYMYDIYMYMYYATKKIVRGSIAIAVTSDKTLYVFHEAYIHVNCM